MHTLPEKELLLKVLVATPLRETITDSAVRRLLYEAGEDIDDLMTLCRADVTSKNDSRVKKYLANFTKVEQKILDVEEKDRVRSFQPPVSGDEIIEFFQIEPSKVVGEIKDEIKEAILDGKISNNRDEAWELMKIIGKRKGMTIKA